jgi:hypothetical protein
MTLLHDSGPDLLPDVLRNVLVPLLLIRDLVQLTTSGLEVHVGQANELGTLPELPESVEDDEDDDSDVIDDETVLVQRVSSMLGEAFISAKGVRDRRKERYLRCGIPLIG